MGRFFGCNQKYVHVFIGVVLCRGYWENLPTSVSSTLLGVMADKTLVSVMVFKW